MLQNIIDILDVKVTQAQASVFGVVGLTLFTALLFISLVRLVLRILRYRREGLPVPDLAKRDFWFMVGLGIPFFGILVVRAAGVKEVGLNLWWLIATTISAVGAMAVMAYYEFRIIESDKDR